MTEKLFGFSRFESGVPVLRATSGPTSAEMYSYLSRIAYETDVSGIDEAQATGQLTGNINVIGVRI